ncbi:MAG: LysR family transcriptional regulator [Proteobacteria bacterium]|nr:LysR family transcriptional regulator [Pseudomonadota bacterium]
MKRDLDLNLLRSFTAVAETKNFTRAAERIHVTQPTLSGQVAALEENYGVKLFERRGRGIELTDLGADLREVTRRLFAQEAEAEQLLTSAQGLTSGLLRVGADAPYQVIPLLARFNRRHPGIRLSMSFGNSERVLQELLDRRCDVTVPREWIMVIKTLAIVAGLIEKLDPSLDVAALLQPRIQEMAWKRLSPARLLRTASVSGWHLFSALRQAPRQVRQLLRQLSAGTWQLNLKHENLDHLITELDRSSNRLAFSIVIAAIVVGSGGYVFYRENVVKRAAKTKDRR